MLWDGAGELVAAPDVAFVVAEYGVLPNVYGDGFELLFAADADAG